MLHVAQSLVRLAVIAQGDFAIDIDLDPAVGLGGGAIGAFLTTLVVGAILVAVWPEYTEHTMARVLDDPVSSFVYGIAWLAFLVLATVVLAITVIGIVVALPLVLVLYLVWAVGSAVAYLAIAEHLVGHEDGWLRPLLVGAGINGALALTGIGGIVAIAVGATGFGAVFQNWYE